MECTEIPSLCNKCGTGNQSNNLTQNEKALLCENRKPLGLKLFNKPAGVFLMSTFSPYNGWTICQKYFFSYATFRLAKKLNQLAAKAKLAFGCTQSPESSNCTEKGVKFEICLSQDGSTTQDCLDRRELLTLPIRQGDHLVYIKPHHYCQRCFLQMSHTLAGNSAPVGCFKIHLSSTPNIHRKIRLAKNRLLKREISEADVTLGTELKNSTSHGKIFLLTNDSERVNSETSYPSITQEPDKTAVLVSFGQDKSGRPISTHSNGTLAAGNEASQDKPQELSNPLAAVGNLANPVKNQDGVQSVPNRFNTGAVTAAMEHVSEEKRQDDISNVSNSSYRTPALTGQVSDVKSVSTKPHNDDIKSVDLKEKHEKNITSLHSSQNSTFDFSSDHFKQTKPLEAKTELKPLESSSLPIRISLSSNRYPTSDSSTMSLKTTASNQEDKNPTGWKQQQNSVVPEGITASSSNIRLADGSLSSWKATASISKIESQNGFLSHLLKNDEPVSSWRKTTVKDRKNTTLSFEDEWNKHMREHESTQDLHLEGLEEDPPPRPDPFFPISNDPPSDVQSKASSSRMSYSMIAKVKTDNIEE